MLPTLPKYEETPEHEKEKREQEKILVCIGFSNMRYRNMTSANVLSYRTVRHILYQDDRQKLGKRSAKIHDIDIDEYQIEVQQQFSMLNDNLIVNIMKKVKKAILNNPNIISNNPHTIKIEFLISGHGLPGSSFIGNGSGTRISSELFAPILEDAAIKLKEDPQFNGIKFKFDATFTSCSAATGKIRPLNHPSSIDTEGISCSYNKYEVTSDDMKNRSETPIKTKDGKQLSVDGEAYTPKAMEGSIIEAFFSALENKEIFDSIKGFTATSCYITDTVKHKMMIEDIDNGHGMVSIIPSLTPSSTTPPSSRLTQNPLSRVSSKEALNAIGRA